MKNLIYTGLGLMLCLSAIPRLAAQDTAEADMQRVIDSLEGSLTYSHGDIELGDGLGTLRIPEGYKYLDPEQARHVLVDIWGNPDSPDISMGFILREEQLITSDFGYVFNIQYEEIGYVKDDDAEDIDYDELLDTMKEDIGEANKEREKLGYEPIHLVGWAAEPHYDHDRKTLYWAKELQFGDLDENTLNYNIRLLGRKGVLVLNAVASMPNLQRVERDLPEVLDMVSFNDGFAYNDFDADLDDVAAWSIGGLVAGKILAKAGFFAVILKFWKLIAVGAAGLFGGVWKRFKGKDDTGA